MSNHLALPIALLAALAFPAAARAQQPAADWKVGIAKAKITPDKPIMMAGYASRKTPSEGVEAELFAKAMAFEDSGGHKALLVTADIIGFPGEMSESIAARLEQSTGIAREAVLLNGSHIHTGPVVAVGRSSEFPEEYRQRIREYAKEFEDKVVAIGEQALAGLKPAKFSWSTGVAHFVMNRREFTPRGVILGVNPRGIADRTVPVMKVENADGELRAVLYGAATHNTTLTGDHMKLDGDYAGYSQAYLEQRFPGVQAMFMLGCAGDSNPYPRGTTEYSKSHGEALGEEVARVLEGKLQPVGGPVRTQFRMVDLPLEKFSREEVEQMAQGAPSYRKFFTDGALKTLAGGATLATSYKAPFALWQFGDSLTMVAFSGETVVDYALMTEKALGPLNLWIAGYSNDIYGYLPTTRVLEEGGYETRGLYAGYGLFTPETEKVVMEAILDMARAAGRTLPQ